MKTLSKTAKIVMTAVFAALIVVLQFVGGIPIGPISITLTLVPIVVGSLLLGPGYGTVLGLIFGIIVSVLSITGKDPGGYAVFVANPFLGWTVCLLKGALAGLLPSLVFKLFNEKKAAPYVLAGLSGIFLALGGFAFGSGKSDVFWKNAVVCIVISLISALYLIIVFYSLKSDNTAYILASMTAPIANTGIFILGMLLFFRPLLEEWAGGSNVVLFIFTGLIGINFTVEFAVAVIFAPAIAVIIKNANKIIGNK